MATIENNLLQELRAIRFSLAASAKQGLPAHGRAERTLGRIERCFMNPLRLAVLGEANSGKSLLINYLLRHQILPSGGFAGDNTEILIRYAPEPSVHSIGMDGSRTRITSKAFGRLVKPENRVAPSSGPAVIYDASASPDRSRLTPLNMIFDGRRGAKQSIRLIEVGLPLDFLQRVEIIEVRSFPDVERTAPSKRAFRRVNLTVWCTLATQAWKETEVLAWRRIPEAHRKGALMLVTYKDAIRSGRDEAKITARLRHAGSTLFNDVALVSLRDAVQSLISSESDAGRLRIDSNIETAENAIYAMIQNWQAHRLQKANRLLRLLAAQIGAAGGNDRRASASRESAIRLERLAMEFLHASPSISLSVAAA